MLFRIDVDEELDGYDLSRLAGCLSRLPYEPGSAFRAELLGGMKWLHWGHTEVLLADLYDAINFQTSATAQNKKAKPGKPYPRPEGKDPEPEVRTVSVAEMGAAMAGFLSQ